MTTGVTPSTSAAAAKLPFSATSTKLRSSV
jgi:hypothetical protein